MQIQSVDLGGKFPKQQLPFSQKGKKWRAQCVNWGAERNVITSSPVRRSVQHKRINYDLLNGKLHMADLKLTINPNEIVAAFIPENIQHYPIMNTKLQVLRGEESSRVFDYRVVITNPNSISEVEKAKKAELMARLTQLIQDQELTEEEYMAKVQELQDYMSYEWKDIREVRANALLNHYWKEYNIPFIFNSGFMDACAVGEEIYQCSIVQGEPIIRKLNPEKVRVYQSGYSNRIEDADMIVIEDYWSPGKIIDTFNDVLSNKDIEYIESIQYNHLAGGGGENENPADAFIRVEDVDEATAADLFPNEDSTLSNLPYDFNGNIRVCQVYWKSKRRIKKIKSYDHITGEETFTLVTEDVMANPNKGEEETYYWINQAWEGTKIGDKIFVNMRPCPIQYNRLSNPSRCHFGIIGSIYNLNDDKPFSLVDIMKPYNYLYDVIYDRMNKLIARNHGKIIKLDLAKVPSNWSMDKWMTILKTAGIAVEDSFKEGNKGMAQGKLAGALNNASSGVVDAELGQSIQQHIMLLEYIRNEMSEVAGISRQREGQISNRETVGGVERATLQSSHITEWLFLTHDDVKKRVLECFLETAKIAMRGRNKKFQYVLSDMSQRVMDIDGDEFSESDYGLVIDNSNETQELKNNLPMLVQAGLQNQKISFSTAMKIWNSSSLAEKQRMVELDEKRMEQQTQQMQQQQIEANQQAAQMEQETRRAEMEQKDAINQRDNETKILVATIQANAKENGESNTISPEVEARLNEQVREFDLSLEFQKKKQQEDLRMKEKQLNKNSNAK